MEKIYIEFIGLPASGKTTIYNSLANEINSNKKAISGTIEFKKLNKLIRHILPIIFNPILTVKFLLFCRKFTKNTTKRKYIYKYLLIDNYLFNRKKFMYYLNNGPLHWTMINKKKIFDLLSLYPANKIYIIFINTSAKNLYKRRKERRMGIGGKREDKSINYNKLLEQHNKTKNFYNYLKNNKHKNTKIEKIIEIDGDKPVSENVKILKEYLK